MNKPSISSPESFWDGIGHSIPSFWDAPSTRYYLECEKMLLEQAFPAFKGKRILKTDLWDEAKNSRILFWAAGQGAGIYGIDISPTIVSQAAEILAKEKCSTGEAGLVVSDLRSIAFADETFDYIYSMGTIEHFPEYKKAIGECYRVLKKGGLAIIGVPNRCDPFFRPLLVTILNSLHLYLYGYEKSFSRRALEKMLAESGFRIIAGSGILFLPGWLRMIDLYVHIKWPALSFLIRPLIRPFAFLYEKVPDLRRCGYLIACVVRKPD